MEIRIDKTDQCPIAYLSGDINRDDTQSLETELTPLLETDRAAVLLEMSGIKFIDSSGLSGLINFVTRANLNNRRVILVSPAPFVAEVFERSRLDKWLEIVGSVLEAYEHLQR